ncbi:MAG: tail fiber domain-containing protein [Saprospiraceae bacterium]
MKKIFSLAAALFFTAIVWAQAPQKMSYQAVVHDAAGQLMKDKNIGMQLSVLQGSESGTPVFIERFFPMTNTNGLVTIEVGGGLSILGSFSDINWATGPFFIKTETDQNGGATYSLSVTSQLLSIPYALLAKNVENVPALKMADLTDVNVENIQPGQILKWNGSTWVAANDNAGGGSGPTYTPGTGISIDANNVISNTGDVSNTNEIQQLEIAGNQLKLTGANTVTLPTGTTYTEGNGISLNNNVITNTGDNDNNAANELQQITLSGTVLTLSQNGGSVTLPTSGGGDNWGTQTAMSDGITLSGNGTPSNPLKIADGGVTPAKLTEQGATNNDAFIFDGNTNNWVIRKPVNVQQGNGIQVITTSNGPLNYLINALDASPTNEIQELSLSGANQGTLNLSNGGGSVNLPLHWSYLPGGTRLRNNGTDGLEIEGHILPATNNNFNLGSYQKSWDHIIGNVVYTNETYTNTINSDGDGIIVKDHLFPEDEFKDLGRPANRWNQLYVSTIFNAKLEGDWLPTTNGTVNLGSSTAKWNNLFLNGNINLGNTEKIYDGGSTRIYINSHFDPDVNDAFDVGGSGLRFRKIFVNTIAGAKHEGDFLPTTNGDVDLGSTTAEWDNLYVNTIFNAKHEGNFIPTTNSTYNIGAPLTRWGTIYMDKISLGPTLNTIGISGSALTCDGNWLPDATNSNDLGTSSIRWRKLYTNTAVDVSSDYRLKENIKPIDFGLKEVLKIKPVSYSLKGDNIKTTQLGYVAQDLKKVIPTVVHGIEDKEMLSVTYTELIPVLTKAIQEQQVMIEALQKEVKLLKEKK